MSKKPEFPFTSMPRMSRRNAVTYPNVKSVISSEGAFSPINLVNRGSTDNYMDSEEILSLGLMQERLHPPNISTRRSDNAPAPVSSVNSSVNEGLRKILDATNIHTKFLDGLGVLSSSEASQVQGKLAVLAAKQRARKETGAAEEDLFGNQHMSTIIPWKNKVEKQATPAEERRKVFQGFNATSFEPPETPQVSESTLKKDAKKNHKKDSRKDYDSQESIASSGRQKLNKSIYASVIPKVNTGMRKDIGQEWKPQGLASSSAPAPIVGQGYVNSNIRASETSRKSLPVSKLVKVLPAVAALSTLKPTKAVITNSPRLVNNYPAEESVKNVKDKLPLTIGPRYNIKKSIGDEANAKRAELILDGTVRLFGPLPPFQKYRIDAKPAEYTPLRNTMQNLHHINKGSNNIGISSPGQGAAAVNKKPVPPVFTTIQAPPSPFLMSTISIPNQLHPIPINGEIIKNYKLIPNNPNKKQVPASSTAKGGKVQLQQRNVGSANKDKGNHPSNNTNDPKPHVKVVPSLGTAPNKYNKIYIGPYSGSDSEGEGTYKSRR